MFARFCISFPCLVLLLFAALPDGRTEGASAGPWVFIAAPETVEAGEPVRVILRVRNAGASVWEADGPDRVTVAALLLDETGNPLKQIEPGRFAYPVPPGGVATVALQFPAPGIPGHYEVVSGLSSPPGAAGPALPRQVVRIAFTAPDRARDNARR